MSLECSENEATPNLMPGTWINDAFSYIGNPLCSFGYESEAVGSRKNYCD